jgi:hypothetical protein
MSKSLTTRAQETAAIKESLYNRARLFELPGFGIANIGELFEPRTAQRTRPRPPTPNRTLLRHNMSTVKIPKFGGDDFRAWFNDFQNCMLLLDCDENRAKQAKFFRVNLIEGSAASIWFDTCVPEAAKSDWNALVPLLRAKFDDSIEDKRAAFRVLTTTKLEDGEIGASDQKGTLKHVAWTRTIAIAKQRAGQDPDNLNAFLVLNNVGPHLRLLLMATGALGTVGQICSKVEALTPNEVETIRDMVRRERDTAEMRTKVAQLEKRLARQPLEPVQYERYVPAAAVPFQRSSWDSQNIPPSTEDVRVEPGPFPATPDGHKRYRTAVESFYKKHGDGAYASLSKPFPLSPGTEAAGSNECFKCGRSSHLRPQCTATYSLPENEQRYRGSVMKQRRENGLGGSQNNKPIRFISQASYEREFRHLVEMPMSPPMMNDDALYEEDLENEGGPSL